MRRFPYILACAALAVLVCSFGLWANPGGTVVASEEAEAIVGGDPCYRTWSMERCVRSYPGCAFQLLCWRSPLDPLETGHSMQRETWCCTYVGHPCGTVVTMFNHCAPGGS